jgi:hypothetical protein
VESPGRPPWVSFMLASRSFSILARALSLHLYCCSSTSEAYHQAVCFFVFLFFCFFVLFSRSGSALHVVLRMHPWVPVCVR